MWPRSISRRTALVGVGSLAAGSAALAGCTERIGGRGSDGFPVSRRDIGASFAADDGRTVTVRNPRLRKSVVVDQHTSPVQSAPETQFLVVDVAVDGGDDRGGSGLGHRFRALVDGSPAEGTSAPLRPEYHPAERGRPVGTSVPVADADEGAVAWVRGLPKSVLWSLPDEVVSAFAVAPAFDVEAVTVSDETDPQVTIRVRNDGDRDGTLYANVSGSQVQDGNVVVGVAVPAGETVTHTSRPGITAPAGETTRVTVSWGAGERALEIRP